MKYLKSILVLFVFSLILLFVACQEETVIEPQVDVVENLGKIKVHHLLVQTNHEMANMIMDDAYVYYGANQTYLGFTINPEYILSDTTGNNGYWFDFYYYSCLFGGTFTVERYEPEYYFEATHFSIDALGEKTWGNDVSNYEGCVPVFEPILLGEKTMSPWSYEGNDWKRAMLNFPPNYGDGNQVMGFDTGVIYKPNHKYMVEFSGVYRPDTGYIADVFYRQINSSIPDSFVIIYNTNDWIQGNPDFSWRGGGSSLLDPQPTMPYNPEHVYQYEYQTDENSIGPFNRFDMETYDEIYPLIGSWIQYVNWQYTMGEIDIKLWDMGPIN